MQRILVVDDEVGIRELLSEILRDEGYDVQLAENAERARQLRNQARPDLVLLDIWMPDTDGITLLKEWATAGSLTMPVIMMSGHGTIDSAVEATRLGAYDFLEKPITLQKLLATVGRALRSDEQRAQPDVTLATFGRSPVMTAFKQQLERVKGLRSPLLFYAEPGSGAEACARSLHSQNMPWVEPEDLAVLAETPLELAKQVREGTLFLHEIGDLTPAEQKGLLSIIGQLNEYNTRLICVTSRALPELVAQEVFDERLYGLLAAVTIRVPSLREHREDVPDLANRLLLVSIESKQVPPRRFSTAALNALRNYDWPGNLGQLENVVHTVAVIALAEEISAHEVNQALAQFSAKSSAPLGLPLDLPLRDARDAFERVYFEHHIVKEGGNMSRVAESVGLERTHLYRKLKHLGVKLNRRNE
jgi:two-component system, NtrC family, nitrogen regulation response regulator NtrX